MPSPIQSPQLAQELRNLTELQGGLRLSLDEIVVPVLARIFEEDEALVWEGVSTGKCWGGGLSGAPPAGERATLRLQNPADSGVIMHVTAFQARSATLAAPSLLNFAVSGTLVINPIGVAQTRDTRRGIAFGAAIPLGSINAEFGPGLITAEWVDVVPDTGFPVLVPLDVYLRPGSSIGAQMATADEQLEGFYQWVERPIRQAEQRL